MAAQGFTLFRAEGLMDLTAAKQKTIIVLGLGSLGSQTVAELAYEWGKLVLIDPDVLKPENIERHYLGRSQIGKNKAEAMRDWLVNEKGVPASSVVAYGTTEETVLASFTHADLVICCIDDQEACRRINGWCVVNSIPAVYSGVYPKGLGGEIISLPDPKRVCYLCADHARGVQSLVPIGTGNYGIDPALLNTPDDHPKAVPALNKSIVAIAADTASAAWQILFPEKGGDTRPNLLYHALDGWVQVAQLLGKSEMLRMIAEQISSTDKLHTVHGTMRLGQPDKDGWYPLEIRRFYWPKVVVPWDRCPMHGQPHNLNDL